MPDPVRRLRALARPPHELWVVDPRRTETARLATRHLAPRPGTDHAVFAYVVRSLLEDGADRDYLRDHADGVERLTRAVDPWTRARASAVSGLSTDALDELCDAIRRHGRVAAITGTGTTMAPTATATEWLVWAMQVVTGSYERPGGLWFQPGFLRCFDRRTLRPSPADPIDWPRPPSRPDLPGFYGEYPCAALADEIEADNLRALIVIGGNPATSFPDAARVERALGSLDVLAVADVVETETTALATHVLPCAGQLERADVPDYVDQYYPLVASQHTAAVVAPGARRKPLWWICAALSERLGTPLLPDDLTLDEATDDDVIRPIASRGRVSFDELRAAPTALVAEGPVRGWVHERLLPDGRWRLAPKALVDDLARHDPAPAEPPAPAAQRAPDTPDTLVLVARRLLRTLNSQLRDAAAPNARLGQPTLSMHPADAAARGIGDGDTVVVASSSGRTRAQAALDDGMRPGCVSLPHGWSTARVGSLTTGHADLDPLTGMVRQTALPVTVTPAPDFRAST
jgi:anaerobic selenocysteine-containing dehydrogenase